MPIPSAIEEQAARRLVAMVRKDQCNLVPCMSASWFAGLSSGIICIIKGLSDGTLTGQHKEAGEGWLNT
jgi:hypothetical protein